MRMNLTHKNLLIKVYGKGKLTMVIKLIQDWCNTNGSELIYLVKFGSDLYGTNTEKSDTDYKGLFLPSKKQCYLNQITKSFSYSTGEADSRNNKSDTDIQLWSLQYFLHLVSKGETNALDLLYSYTHPKVLLYAHTNMSKIFENHHSLFSTNDCVAYIDYALGQAKKYGIKGTRLGVIKRVCKFLETVKEEDNNKKLFTIIDRLLEVAIDTSYCFTKTLKDEEVLVICGKVHQFKITIEEFKARLFKEYGRYGECAKLAEQSEGIDWKALSHAVRAIHQMLELLATGKINYPLVTAPLLKSIKAGELTFQEVEHLIIHGLGEVNKIILNTTKHRNIINKQLVEEIILSFYK